MQVMIKHADGTIAKALTKPQFNLIHDRLVAAMNNGKALKDADVVKWCAEAGLPIDFTVDTVPVVAKKRTSSIYPRVKGRKLGTEPLNHEAFQEKIAALAESVVPSRITDQPVKKKPNRI